jgi:hypothetical protein
MEAFLKSRHYTGHRPSRGRRTQATHSRSTRRAGGALTEAVDRRRVGINPLHSRRSGADRDHYCSNPGSSQASGLGGRAGIWKFDDLADPQTITKHAWELVHEANERYDERHDEFDDPDQGGEA